MCSMQFAFVSKESELAQGELWIHIFQEDTIFKILSGGAETKAGCGKVLKPIKI